VASWLLGGGLTLALGAWLTSTVLLFHLGGLRHIQHADPAGAGPARNVVLWDPERTSSWWWLAIRAPHSTTPIDILHTLGSAMAVLGAMLLLTRLSVVANALRPLAAAGAMTLTLYCGHLLVLATDLMSDRPFVVYGLLVVAALSFAFGWQTVKGQGPLERVVAAVSGRAHRAVAARPAEREPG
jgi:uncharacterized membrane protein YeiB